MGYEKFIIDADQASMMATWVDGVDLSENGQALDSLLTNGPGNHYLGTAHTLANFETAFWSSAQSDNNSFEQWDEDGAKDSIARAHKTWTRMLREYEAPPLDAAREAELDEWIVKCKASFPDSDI